MPPRKPTDDLLVPGLKRDLASMPDDIRLGGLARAAMKAAKTIDTVPMTPRDEAAMLGRYQQLLSMLHEMAPGERKGDKTDDLQERRNRRLQQDAG